MHLRPLRRAASAASLLLALACAHGGAGAAASPPQAARRDHVDVWHGERFSDPWFWLRERENPDVRRYLEAENAYTAAQTRGIAPFADALYREMHGGASGRYDALHDRAFEMAWMLAQVGITR